MKKYKISTPSADEYREIFFYVNEEGIITKQEYDRKTVDFVGQTWEEIDFHFFSIWKLYSSFRDDNVYPRIQLIEEYVND